MEYLIIFNAEFKKMLSLQKRYLLSFLTDVIVYYILFMGLYLFIKVNVNQLTSLELSQIITKQIVGYISWFFFSFTISFMNNGIYRELTEGTFEQLCLNHNKIIKILFIKLVVYSIRNIMIIFPLTLALVLSTGVKLNLNYQIISIFLIMLMGIMGFSFLLGGITLVYKKIGQLPFLISIFFLGTSLIDISALQSHIQKILYSLPFNKGTNLMKSLISGYFIPMNDLLLLLLNSIFYLIIGILVFQLCYRKALNDGTLSKF